MWTYIIRRLLIMIPTLFGVTVVSFCIMQVAPGDPMLSRSGAGGTAGQSSQPRESYVLQKRELKLDRPLLLNFRYFRDYSNDLQVAAHYRPLTIQQIADDLEYAVKHRDEPSVKSRLRFLRSLKRIDDFKERFDPPDLTESELKESGLTSLQWQKKKKDSRLALASELEKNILVWCEDVGTHGVLPAIGILKHEQSSKIDKVGAIQCLVPMVVSPFDYTFSRNPSAAEENRVVSSWKRIWEKRKGAYSELDPDRQKFLEDKLENMTSISRGEMFKLLQGTDLFAEDAPFFIEVVFDNYPLNKKAIAAEFLRLYINDRIQANVSLDASDEEVNAVTANWISHYEANQQKYQFGSGKKIASIFADTQYAHMVWRLVTFQFGTSTLKTKEPVGELIWNAVMISAPLMIMAQLVIYLVSVPLGIVCSANRGNFIDRAISLKLFLLYSVPPFVAGMLFLLFFCYGDYVKWFPMERLHSAGADEYGFLRYMMDYLWHAFLPVTCLSLFSLAALAMYSRSSMLDVLGQDYIRTARAKGVSRGKVIMKHALRNSLIPIITLFANFLPAMLGGSVLIEYIFGIPGMGRLGLSSIELKDFPTVMALIYIQAIVVMLSILLTDLLYVFVDPRISFEGQGTAT